MTLRKFAPALVAAFVGLAVAPAVAADLPQKPVYKAPVADMFNPWMIRLRALGVVTRNSGVVDQVAGSGLTTTDAVVPELDITYFFTRNFAAELILGVTKHHVTGTGAAATNGLDVGKAWLLPPTLTLQYHFNPEGTLRPYVGAGINYTRFSSVDLDANLAIGGTTGLPLRIDRSSFGWALQVGADYKIADKWFLNVDLKYVTIDTDIYVKNNAVALQGQKVSKLDIDPLLFSVGIGYRF